jgi:hypothetical protein
MTKLNNDLSKREQMNQENHELKKQLKEQHSINKFSNHILNAPKIPKRQVFIEPPKLNLNHVSLIVNNKRSNNYSPSNYNLKFTKIYNSKQ